MDERVRSATMTEEIAEWRRRSSGERDSWTANQTLSMCKSDSDFRVRVRNWLGWGDTAEPRGERRAPVQRVHLRHVKSGGRALHPLSGVPDAALQRHRQLHRPRRGGPTAAAAHGKIAPGPQRALDTGNRRHSLARSRLTEYFAMNAPSLPQLTLEAIRARPVLVPM